MTDDKLFNKKKRAVKNEERAYQRRFIKELPFFIKELHFPVYVFVDQDSPDRTAVSEWDFSLSANSHTVYFESKKTEKAPANFEAVLKLLRPSQAIGRKKILYTGGYYAILVFCPEYKDGVKCFIQDGRAGFDGLKEIHIMIKSLLCIP